MVHVPEGLPFHQVYSHLAIHFLSVITGNERLEKARVQISRWRKQKQWNDHCDRTLLGGCWKEQGVNEYRWSWYFDDSSHWQLRVLGMKTEWAVNKPSSLTVKVVSPATKDINVEIEMQKKSVIVSASFFYTFRLLRPTFYTLCVRITVPDCRLLR